MCFILGSQQDIPNSDKKNFVGFGAFMTKEDAKNALTSLSNVVMQDAFKGRNC
jgi:hypothetical protein